MTDLVNFKDWYRSVHRFDPSEQEIYLQGVEEGMRRVREALTPKKPPPPPPAPLPTKCRIVKTPPIWQFWKGRTVEEMS